MAIGFIHLMTKIQNTSTKFQTNSKFEISMTETKSFGYLLRRTKATRHDRFLAVGSRSHSSMMNRWERLPAAIETNLSDVGYFISSLIKHGPVLNFCFWSLDIICYLRFVICDLLFFGFLPVRFGTGYLASYVKWSNCFINRAVLQFPRGC